MFLKLFHCQGTTNTLLWETLVHTFRETGASVEVLYNAIELWCTQNNSCGGIQQEQIIT